MDIDFALEYDRRVYVEWTEGPCTAWPSPPYKAPMWPLVRAVVSAKRFLDIGSALGYSAALMADAGGPESRVDAIEVDPLHASLAEAELRRKGLESRVRVITGDSRKVLPELTGPYDIVFVDGPS